MGVERLTGRIVNAADLIDGILDAGSIRDYTSRNQMMFMREQLTSMASHLRHHTAPAAGAHALMSRMVVDSWPLDSTLGRQLVDIEDDYLALLQGTRRHP